MTEGPFGGPRPFADSTAEINIFFEQRDLDDEDIIPVGNVVVNHGPVGDQVSGPTGELRNVVSLESRANNITLSGLQSLEEKIEQLTELTVEDIELIF